MLEWFLTHSGILADRLAEVLKGWSETTRWSLNPVEGTLGVEGQPSVRQLPPFMATVTDILYNNIEWREIILHGRP